MECFSRRPQCLAAPDPPSRVGSGIRWSAWLGLPRAAQGSAQAYIVKESLNLLYTNCQTPALCQHQSDPFFYTECDVLVPVARELGQRILALKSQLPWQLPGWLTEAKADGFPWL